MIVYITEKYSHYLVVTMPVNQRPTVFHIAGQRLFKFRYVFVGAGNLFA